MWFVCGGFGKPSGAPLHVYAILRHTCLTVLAAQLKVRLLEVSQRISSTAIIFSILKKKIRNFSVMFNYFPVCLSSCGELYVCTGEPEQRVPLELPPALGKGGFFF